jgi:hypothetical protein
LSFTRRRGTFSARSADAATCLTSFYHIDVVAAEPFRHLQFDLRGTPSADLAEHRQVAHARDVISASQPISSNRVGRRAVHAVRDLTVCTKTICGRQ